MKSKIIYIYIFVVIIIAVSVGFYFGIFLPKIKTMETEKKQQWTLEHLKKAEQAQEQQKQDAINAEKERIKALVDSTEEITLNDTQLKSYYAVYDDPYVINIRKALDGYLAGTNDGMDFPEHVIEKHNIAESSAGLDSFDKEYYKSKFAVLSLDNGITGGKLVDILFQDKPDRVFKAWVYKLGDGNYDLRDFWENTKATQDIAVTLKAFGKYVFDKDHSL